MAGKMDKAKGNIKQGIGKLTGNKKLENEGKNDKAAGKVKSGVDKTKKVLQGK